VGVQAVPFNPELFVDRKKETKLFIDTVRAKTRQAYLEFNGVAGQGKSELLKWIYYNAKKEGYRAAYVDFELPQYHRPEIYPILETIADHLTIQTSPDSFRAFQEKLPLCLEQLQKFYRDSLENPQEADRRPLKQLEDELVTAFNQGLSSLLKSKKLVLCLDSTEKAYLLVLRNFEDQVLQHYTRERNFMLVTAGQERVVWRNTEIRKLIERRELSRLDSEGSQEQVKTLSQKFEFALQESDQIFSKMFQLTLGHPFSNYKLVKSWTNGFTSPLSEIVVEEQFAKSIQELIREIIEDRILERLQLNEEYPPASDILWYLAPLRRIEFGTLWYVLSTFMSKWFEGQPFEFFERLMEEFQKTYIFTPFQLGVGYALEPVVRNILLWDMRVNAHNEYVKAQKTLADQYHNWAEQSRDATQIKNIVERLYHYAIYLRETQLDNVDELVQNELKHYLRAYFTLEFTGGDFALREQLNRLYSTLENDKELATLIDIPESLSIIKGFMI
jgi:hypothetical protein